MRRKRETRMTKNGKAPGEERPGIRADREMTTRLNINVCAVLLGTPGLPAPVLCVFVSHHEVGFCASRKEPVRPSGPPPYAPCRLV